MSYAAQQIRHLCYEPGGARFIEPTIKHPWRLLSPFRKGRVA